MSACEPNSGVEGADPAEEAAATTQRKTNCQFCGYYCGFEATVDESGRVVGLTGDATRYPYDGRILAGCRRWPMNLSVFDDPRRVNYPLRRVGARGSGQWERVSWDEALDAIAERLKALRDAYGPGTLASMIGGPHTSFWPLHRFMTLFGSPNNAGIGQICWNPRIWMDVVTFGWTIEADITDETRCLVLWGTNPAESDNSVFWREILRLSRSDTHVVVIDPRRTRTAAAADLWLAPKPGMDCTLALAMVATIIEEGLIDADFVERWCSGFDELAAHVRVYRPEDVAERCGVAATDIRQAARWFAEGPSALVSGRGIDQCGARVAPTHRAICALRAITGNLDRQGACVLTEMSDFVPEVDLEMTLEHFDALASRCLNTAVTPLQCYDGYVKVNALTERLGRRLPVRYLTSVHPDLLLRAMETGEPYPVRALIVDATNPLVTYGDAHRVRRALEGLDLIVSLEYYLTPTAALADYVLPCAAAMERPLFQAHGGVANIAYGGPAAVAPLYERKSDYDVFRELGLRLGQADAWPHKTFSEALAAVLEPAGMDWETYCACGIYSRMPAFYKHELPGPDGAPQGFATTTGKVELASEILPALAGERLPSQAEAPRRCSPELKARLEPEGAHGLTLITGARKQPYNASMYLNREQFRQKHPYPKAEVSPTTAERLGLTAGQVVALTTDSGEARFILDTMPMADDVIAADYGWWHAEWTPQEANGLALGPSNVNVLTSCSLEGAEPMIGTWSYNGFECMVRPVKEPLDWREGFTSDPARDVEGKDSDDREETRAADLQ